MEQKTFYKILNADLNHYGFQYKLGLNIDDKPFNHSGSCQSGGFYYTNKEHLHKYLSYGCYIADVVVPDDAQIYAEPDNTKWKADKIIITKITWIGDHELWQDSAFLSTINIKNYDYTCLTCNSSELMLKIKRAPLSIMFVKNQTENLCMLAITQNYAALQYIKVQTETMCLIAVLLNSEALQYVKHQTEKVCIAAVARNFHTLRLVKKPTKKICAIAITKNLAY